MFKTTRMWTCALNLVLISFDRFVPIDSFFGDDSRLAEGSRCPLANGMGEGVCTKVSSCPSKTKEIVAGHYSDVDRCGFVEFDEIVCCGRSTTEVTTNRERPSETACTRYKKMVSELEDAIFRTVVFNGVRAMSGEFPHMVALGYPAADDEEGAIGGMKYVCGGTLISEKHVVTAAHCVSNVQGLVPVEVLLGTIDLTNQHPVTTQRISISLITRHPDYRQSFNYHDVAILELRNSIKLTSYVQPTCLTTLPPKDLSAGAPARLDILGWGAVDLEGTQSTRLLKAQGLRFVGITECSKSYRNNLAKTPNGLDDGMICVTDPNATRRADTCWGDSGGPLLISSGPFSPLAGVTSFGQACGGNTPGVYASIYKYLNWIESVVWPTLN